MQQINNKEENNEIDIITSGIDRILVTPNRTFSYIKENIRSSFWLEVKKIIYFFYHNERIWRMKSKHNTYEFVCKFIHSNGKFCTRFDTNDGYCCYHKNGIIQESQSTTEIGDNSEIYIKEILEKSDQFLDIQKVGSEPGKLDIIFQVQEDINNGFFYYRGIQVKTISDNFDIFMDKEYSDDTLIVGVNKERNKFCLCLYKDVKICNKKKLCIYYDKENEYSLLSFKNDEINIITGTTFTQQLYIMSKTSTITDNVLSENQTQERNYNNKLREQCIKRNLSFKLHHTMDSDIDLIINGRNCQCKTSSRERNQGIYDYNLHHLVYGQNVPYSFDTEVDFFIFMPVDDLDFSAYIIPKDVLLYLGFLSSLRDKGKVGISIPNNTYQRFHRFKQFKDRYDFFNMPNSELTKDKFKYTEKDNIISRFEFQISYRNLEDVINFYVDNSSLQIKCGVVDNNKIIYFSCSIKEEVTLKSINCVFKINKPHINMRRTCHDFYIYGNEKSPNLILIIPLLEMINQGYIGSNLIPINKQIKFPVIRIMNKDHWAFRYINDYNQLIFL